MSQSVLLYISTKFSLMRRSQETERRSSARSRPRRRCWWCRWGRSATQPVLSRGRTPPMLLRSGMLNTRFKSWDRIYSWMIDYSESHDRIWENHPWCTRWSREEVGWAECRKRREEFCGIASCSFRWTARCGLFISGEADTKIKLPRDMCSLCFIQNKNSKHYHQ